MNRCNADASSYSYVNGFRACSDCIDAGELGDLDSLMVEAPEVLGPCDVPSETRDAFWERFKADKGKHAGSDFWDDSEAGMNPRNDA